MTTVTNAEIEAYVAQVGAALADLDADARVDLLEDLPDHLAEVLSEGDGAGLRERLGDPADYAAELRSAAGYPAPGAQLEPSVRLAEVFAEFRDRLERADRALGALLGYGRAIGVARALRPGWWVLRGWIVALMIGGAFLHAHWTGYIPRIGGDRPLGAVVVVACVLASAWIGRRTAQADRQTRVLAVLASITIAVFGIFIARNIVGWDYQTYGGRVVYPATSLAPASSAPTMTP